MEMKPLVLDLRSMIKILIDNVEVTKDIWEKLTERFLYIDEDGIERIKNEIEWTDLTV